MTPLDKAKIELYRLLLAQPVESLTEVDIELGYQLARDPVIQDVLDKHFKKTGG